MPAWIEIARADHLQPGESKECIVGGRIIALFRVADTYYALDGICPHHGGPLGKGALSGCVVTCPWHGWQFDVTDGAYQSSSTLHQTSYKVKLDSGGVFVRLPDDSISRT